MKKTKLLMPILGVGAIAATVAPMVAMTSCNKEESPWQVFNVTDSESDHKTFKFDMKYTKSLTEGVQYSTKTIGSSIPPGVDSITLGGLDEDLVIHDCYIELTEALEQNESKKVSFSFELFKKEGKKVLGTFSITVTCVYQEHQ
ncbi:MAG: hypothetical protein ACOQNV_03305 [Mycoplasmoidaceae bacterium]